MPYKIVVDVGEIEQRFVFVVRSWRNIQGLEEKVLSDAIKDADMQLVDRLDEKFGTKSKFYYFNIVKTIRQATVIVVVCIPDQKTGIISPNVIFELGLADSLGKPTLIITASKDLGLSDLDGREFFIIDNYKIDELQKSLTLAIINAKENSKPEWIIDKEPPYNGIDLISYNEENNNKRIKLTLKLSLDIKRTCTRLQQGSIASFNRLLSQLRISDPVREIQTIAQTLDELKRGLQEFEIYCEDMLESEISKYKMELDEIEKLGKDIDKSNMIMSVEDRLGEFKIKCKDFSESTFQIRNKFTEPKEVEATLFKSLWPLEQTILRVINKCDNLISTCIESI